MAPRTRSSGGGLQVNVKMEGVERVDQAFKDFRRDIRSTMKGALQQAAVRTSRCQRRAGAPGT
jgi:hypothetical protein